MSFDLAIGVNNSELNVASESVYTALYPNVFTGSQTITYQGMSFTVAWDVKQAPTFDLQATSAAVAAQLDSFRQKTQTGPSAHAEAISQHVTAMAAASPAFSVLFPAVNITLSGGVTVTLSLPLTAYCTVAVSTSGVLTFVVAQVTTPPLTDPVENYLVQHVVVPQIQTIAQSLLTGINIPPLSVAGVNLSIPSVGIVNSSIIAAANLQSAGTPPPPDNTTPWPDSPFFALLGPNILQQGVASALASASNNFSSSGGGGNSWAGYNWSYGISLASPAVTIAGTSLNVSFSLNGSVSGGVEVVYVPLSLSFNATSTPDPAVTLGMQVNGNTVDLITQQVQPFVIVVTPGSSVPDWVLGWLIAAIVDAVTVSLTPLITQFLGGINVAGFTIPTYSVSIAGTTITLSPSGLQPANVGGYLAMLGQIVIS